jgi:hypothetical protein
LELLTAATQDATETAAVTHDKLTVAKYGRFVAPMIETILRKNPSSVRSAELSQELNGIYRSYVAQKPAS